MKTVLVTGGSRGIGAETVKIFAENGYSVILNYNKSEQAARDVCSRLRDKGFDVHAYRCDVTDSASVSEMFAYIRKYFKKLDVLVNNAGVALYKQIQDVSEAEYDLTMDVNCKGAFLCSKQAVKLFYEREGGSIVNVSSIWGLMGASCESVYSMSKFALIGLTKSLDAELSDSGIKVNCVCPPIVETDMTSNLSQEDKSEFCEKYDVKVVSARKVAKKIFECALSGDSGQTVNEF